MSITKTVENSISRSRGSSAPCPPGWNNTTNKRNFVRFLSTKHGSLKRSVGPEETPFPFASQRGGIYLIPITRRGSP
ncbi:hypothetical protein AMTR_s00017p00257600 [Amborella trichopoda]|uniref:Uncharacterized protein n=1 Tax=Amborella trichopoda TaxID=13333 RepID=W1PNR0_AMBTC|nr:hypothetical protein AMTR_s00017p00257600 [Amborella trichopoda]